MVRDLLTHPDARNMNSRNVSEVEKRFACRSVTAAEEITKRRDCVVPTKIEELDRLLLDGGLRRGEVVELCGRSGSGKSLLCHVLSALLALPAGNDGCNRLTVVYIDTANSLCPSTLLSAATMWCRGGTLSEDHAGISSTHVNSIVKSALKRISCVAAFDLSSVMRILRSIASRKDNREASSLKLLILDSVSTILSPIVGGEKSSAGHASMIELGIALKQLALTCDIPVLVTNSTVDDRRQGTNAPKSRKPALGRAWQGVPSVRLWIEDVLIQQNEAHSGSGTVTEGRQHCFSIEALKSPRVRKGTKASRIAIRLSGA